MLVFINSAAHAEVKMVESIIHREPKSVNIADWPEMLTFARATRSIARLLLSQRGLMATG